MASNKNHVYVDIREMVSCGRDSTKTGKTEQRALMGRAGFTLIPIKAILTFDSKIASIGYVKPTKYPDA